MHEYSITQSILNVALEAAENRQIAAIDLVIGDLSSVVDDSVQFYFDMLSADTLAEGAELRFRRIPVEVFCCDCAGNVAGGIPLPYTCPLCGGNRLEVRGGREFFVESIEVK
jgi:hydrogenase nickel incorporation protein HypA/HybF